MSSEPSQPEQIDAEADQAAEAPTDQPQADQSETQPPAKRALAAEFNLPPEDELINDLDQLAELGQALALQVFPAGVNFETQETEEQLILLMRRHPVTNVKWLATALILALLPVGVWQLGLFADWLSDGLKLAIILVWELLVLGFALEEFLRWFFNIYIVTDQRVVDIDFPNLLHREMNDADLLKIQDVTVRSTGMASAIFNFGNIYIQTASEKQVLEFLAVANADKVASVIRLLALKREEIIREHNQDD